MQVSSVPSLEEAKNYIYTVDFSKLLGKLIRHQGWLRSDAEETSLQYRNYLFLLRKYAAPDYRSLPPSEDIDEFWHQHILDTQAYQKDSACIFGSYLHHYPYFGIDGKTDLRCLHKAFQQTQALYFKEFGVQIEPTRSKYPKMLYFFMKKFSK